MAIININSILARYQYSFGYVAGNVAKIAANRLWSILKNMPQYKDASYTTGESEQITLFEVADTSFANVVFTSSKTGKKYSFGADGTLEYGSGKKYMAPPLMLSFSRSKNVVKTTIDRSEIEVIEYFGLKPYKIKVQGILIDMDNHIYPGELLQMVNEIFETPGTFAVESAIFYDLGISEVFFEDGFDVSFVEGYADTVKFSVDAVMTSPLELIATGL